MQNKKIPLRKCIITDERLPKNELLRIVKTSNNEVILDLTGKVNGHGIYLKKDLEVLESARKTKKIDHFLKLTIDDYVYEEIEKYLKK